MPKTYLIKDCNTKYTKNSRNLTIRKQKHWIKNEVKILADTSPKYTDSKYVYKKRLHIVCQQGNAN